MQNFQGANMQNQKEEEMKKMEEMKNSILVQILDQSARARCMYKVFFMKFIRCSVPRFFNFGYILSVFLQM